MLLSQNVQQLLNVLPDAIFLLNGDGVLQWINRRAEAMFGYAADELVGKRIERLLVERCRADHSENMAAYVAEPAARPAGGARVELVGLRKSGDEFPIDVSLSPLESDGELLVIAAIRDIAERKRAEAAVHEDEQRLRVARHGSGQGTSELRRAEEALRNSEKRHQALLTGLPDLVLLLDRDAVFLDYQIPGVSLLLAPPERLLGHHVKEVLPARLARQIEIAIPEALRTNEVQSIECSLATESESHRYEARVIPTNDSTVTVVARDVTHPSADDERDRQALKMQTIGLLAGGVAHDFNNLLTVMSGLTELVLESLDDTDSRRADLLEVLKAAERAETMIRQLLPVNRRPALQSRALDVNVLVAGIETLLRRTLGEGIELVLAPGSVEIVRMDSSELERVLLNLAVNARDAMPDGGKLCVATETVDVDEAWALSCPPMTPGRYVLIRVKDSGVGMTAETQARIFEPFFTTKPRGQGTGLGLATAYNIVKQSEGYIWVDSQVGRGTSFTIYLPSQTIVRTDT